MTEKPVWEHCEIQLKDLKPWRKNPRLIKEIQAERLLDSFDRFGQVETIAIGPNNEVYNGHQRLSVLMDKKGGEYYVHCMRSDRKLTEKERERLTVYLHKGTTGEWDFDMLANEFEFDELIDWGFNESELKGFSMPPDEPQSEPQLTSECYVEIYCDRLDLDYIRETLAEWSNRPNVTVNISE